MTFEKSKVKNLSPKKDLHFDEQFSLRRKTRKRVPLQGLQSRTPTKNVSC